MLSEQWLIKKWIKYFTVQVGSATPSSWNGKITSQLKESFFQPIMNFSPKVFWSLHGYKTVIALGPVMAFHSADLVGCVLSLAMVTQLGLPDIGDKEAQR